MDVHNFWTFFHPESCLWTFSQKHFERCRRVVTRSSDGFPNRCPKSLAEVLPGICSQRPAKTIQYPCSWITSQRSWIIPVISFNINQFVEMLSAFVAFLPRTSRDVAPSRIIYLSFCQDLFSLRLFCVTSTQHIEAREKKTNCHKFICSLSR